MGPYVNVIKETRSLIFAYGLLNADGELSQRRLLDTKACILIFDGVIMPGLLRNQKSLCAALPEW